MALGERRVAGAGEHRQGALEAVVHAGVPVVALSADAQRSVSGIAHHLRRRLRVRLEGGQVIVHAAKSNQMVASSEWDAVSRMAVAERQQIPQQQQGQQDKRQRDLIELMSNWFDDVQRLDAQTLAKLMRMGARVQKLLELRCCIFVIASFEVIKPGLVFAELFGRDGHFLAVELNRLGFEFLEALIEVGVKKFVVFLKFSDVVIGDFKIAAQAGDLSVFFAQGLSQ